MVVVVAVDACAVVVAVVVVVVVVEVVVTLNVFRHNQGEIQNQRFKQAVRTHTHVCVTAQQTE